MAKRKSAAFRRSAREKLRGKAGTANSRQIRALFGIIVEGETEERYFTMDCLRDKSVRVIVNPGKPNDPPALSNAAQALIEQLKRGGELRSGDQVWVVLDKDNWTDDQLEEVFAWAAERSSQGDRGVGLCIPQFEYWLLLHFDDAYGIGTQQQVLNSLKNHLPAYEKNQPLRLEVGQIQAAIDRATRKFPRHYESLKELEEDIGLGGASTTVHFLVKKMLDSLGLEA